MSKIVLSKDKTECIVVAGELILKVGQTIDYKSATEYKPSIGKIEKFMYAGHSEENKDSVWMRIVDSTDNNQSEWISVNVWKEQYDKGMFGNNNKKPKTNGSKKPEDSSKYAF